MFNVELAVSNPQPLIIKGLDEAFDKVDRLQSKLEGFQSLLDHLNGKKLVVDVGVKGGEGLLDLERSVQRLTGLLRAAGEVDLAKNVGVIGQDQMTKQIEGRIATMQRAREVAEREHADALTRQRQLHAEYTKIATSAGGFMPTGPQSRAAWDTRNEGVSKAIAEHEATMRRQSVSMDLLRQASAHSVVLEGLQSGGGAPPPRVAATPPSQIGAATGATDAHAAALKREAEAAAASAKAQENLVRVQKELALASLKAAESANAARRLRTGQGSIAVPAVTTAPGGTPQTPGRGRAVPAGSTSTGGTPMLHFAGFEQQYREKQAELDRLEANKSKRAIAKKVQIAGEMADLPQQRGWADAVERAIKTGAPAVEPKVRAPEDVRQAQAERLRAARQSARDDRLEKAKLEAAEKTAQHAKTTAESNLEMARQARLAVGTGFQPMTAPTGGTPVPHSTETVYHGTKTAPGLGQRSGYYPGSYHAADEAEALKHGPNVFQTTIDPAKIFPIKEPQDADRLKEQAAKAGFGHHTGSGHPEAQYLQSQGYYGLRRGKEVVLFENAPPSVAATPPSQIVEDTRRGAASTMQAHQQAMAARPEMMAAMPAPSAASAAPPAAPLTMAGAVPAVPPEPPKAVSPLRSATALQSSALPAVPPGAPPAPPVSQSPPPQSPAEELAAALAKTQAQQEAHRQALVPRGPGEVPPGAPPSPPFDKGAPAPGSGAVVRDVEAESESGKSRSITTRDARGVLTRTTVTADKEGVESKRHETIRDTPAFYREAEAALAEDFGKARTGLTGLARANVERRHATALRALASSSQVVLQRVTPEGQVAGREELPGMGAVGLGDTLQARAFRTKAARFEDTALRLARGESEKEIKDAQRAQRKAEADAIKEQKREVRESAETLSIQRSAQRTTQKQEKAAEGTEMQSGRTVLRTRAALAKDDVAAAKHAIAYAHEERKGRIDITDEVALAKAYRETAQAYRDKAAAFNATRQSAHHVRAARDFEFEALRMENAALHTEHKAAQIANRSKPGFFGAVREKLGTVGTYSIAASAIYGGVSAVRQGIGSAVAVDRQMATLQAVYRGTAEGARELAQATLDLAVANGRSGQEAMDSAVKWGRLGLSQRDATEAVRVSLMAANVSELDVAESTEHLSAMMNNYRMSASDLVGVLNSMNSISNNLNVTVGDLMQGISRVGPLAKQSGMGSVEMMGLIGAAKSATGRPGSELGTALKSSIIGFADPVKQKTLKSRFGIDVFEDTGEMKTSPEIFADLWKKTQGMSRGTKSELLKEIGGKTQGSRIEAILDNYVTAQMRSIVAQRDLNSAQREGNLILDSTSSKLTSLGAAWTKLFSDAHQGGIKPVVNALLDTATWALGAKEASVPGHVLRGFGRMTDVMLHPVANVRDALKGLPPSLIEDEAVGTDAKRINARVTEATKDWSTAARNRATTGQAGKFLANVLETPDLSANELRDVGIAASAGLGGDIEAQDTMGAEFKKLAGPQNRGARDTRIRAVLVQLSKQGEIYEAAEKIALNTVTTAVKESMDEARKGMKEQERQAKISSRPQAARRRQTWAALIKGLEDTMDDMAGRRRQMAEMSDFEAPGKATTPFRENLAGRLSALKMMESAPLLRTGGVETEQADRLARERRDIAARLALADRIDAEAGGEHGRSVEDIARLREERDALAGKPAARQEMARLDAEIQAGPVMYQGIPLTNQARGAMRDEASTMRTAADLEMKMNLAQAPAAGRLDQMAAGAQDVHRRMGAFGAGLDPSAQMDSQLRGALQLGQAISHMADSAEKEGAALALGNQLLSLRSGMLDRQFSVEKDIAQLREQQERQGSHNLVRMSRGDQLQAALMAQYEQKIGRKLTERDMAGKSPEMIRVFDATHPHEEQIHEAQVERNRIRRQQALVVGDVQQQTAAVLTGLPQPPPRSALGQLEAGIGKARMAAAANSPMPLGNEAGGALVAAGGVFGGHVGQFGQAVEAFRNAVQNAPGGGLPGQISEPEKIRAAQETLQVQGFLKGRPSGEMDEPTAQGIRRFQERNALPVTGELTPQTERAIQKWAVPVIRQSESARALSAAEANPQGYTLPGLEDVAPAVTAGKLPAGPSPGTALPAAQDAGEGEPSYLGRGDTRQAQQDVYSHSAGMNRVVAPRFGGGGFATVLRSGGIPAAGMGTRATPLSSDGRPQDPASTPLKAAIQRELKDQGFFHGEVGAEDKTYELASGQTITETQGALRRFQILQGLEVTGGSNAETIAALGLSRGPGFGSWDTEPERTRQDAQPAAAESSAMLQHRGGSQPKLRATSFRNWNAGYQSPLAAGHLATGHLASPSLVPESRRGWSVFGAAAVEGSLQPAAGRAPGTATRSGLRPPQSGSRAAAVQGSVPPREDAAFRRREYYARRRGNVEEGIAVDPHGVDYLRNLAKVYEEQNIARQKEASTGIPTDSALKGDAYAKAEAERRSQAEPLKDVYTRDSRTGALSVSAPRFSGGGSSRVGPGADIVSGVKKWVDANAGALPDDASEAAQSRFAAGLFVGDDVAAAGWRPGNQKPETRDQKPETSLPPSQSGIFSRTHSDDVEEQRLRWASGLQGRVSGPGGEYAMPTHHAPPVLPPGALASRPPGEPGSESAGQASLDRTLDRLATAQARTDDLMRQMKLEPAAPGYDAMKNRVYANELDNAWKEPATRRQGEVERSASAAGANPTGGAVTVNFPQVNLAIDVATQIGGFLDSTKEFCQSVIDAHMSEVSQRLDAFARGMRTGATQSAGADAALGG